MRYAATIVGLVFVMGCGGGLRRSTEPHRLAGHSWWRGKVDIANLDRLLAEMQANDSVTIVANQAGRYAVVPEENEPGKSYTWEWIIVLDNQYCKRPEVAALGEPRLYLFVRLRIGQRLSQAEAERILEDGLTHNTVKNR